MNDLVRSRAVWEDVAHDADRRRRASIVAPDVALPLTDSDSFEVFPIESASAEPAGYA